MNFVTDFIPYFELKILFLEQIKTDLIQSTLQTRLISFVDDNSFKYAKNRFNKTHTTIFMGCVHLLGTCDFK